MEIQVHNLCKSYGGETVLRDVNFTAGPGVTCLMAPSGAGKTTLLRILLGLERPDSGTVRVPNGCRWAAVFQEDRLLEQLDAMGNLRFVLGKDYREETAAALLAELGLGDVGNKPVRDFSGGMKRRLALARALLAPSDVLVLDEPFTGLDGENRAKALSCVRQAAEGKPVLLVTHDESDAADLDAALLRL
ncbi:ATP-binding cassette domain-containing protein [Oscillibacter valericigenes]|uniref:ATP-binding cassette domain-containing protein n=1 Tax=Oscillibacter valericigenes TaxID=351091 RepID=UPI001F3DFCCF|nr:ATP-binding cassette domain-containing protein [Oscillibacter valericigenes]MCF2664964.1 ATP-binding cassette domain-containing protein [Oscillibacter valericigenes]